MKKKINHKNGHNERIKQNQFIEQHIRNKSNNMQNNINESPKAQIPEELLDVMKKMLEQNSDTNQSVKQQQNVIEKQQKTIEEQINLIKEQQEQIKSISKQPVIISGDSPYIASSPSQNLPEDEMYIPDFSSEKDNLKSNININSEQTSGDSTDLDDAASRLKKLKKKKPK